MIHQYAGPGGEACPVVFPVFELGGNILGRRGAIGGQDHILLQKAGTIILKICIKKFSSFAIKGFSSTDKCA